MGQCKDVWAEGGDPGDSSVPEVGRSLERNIEGCEKAGKKQTAEGEVRG